MTVRQIKENADNKPYFYVLLDNQVIGIVTINHPEYYCGSLIHAKDNVFN